MEIRQDDMLLLTKIRHFNSERLPNEPNIIEDIGNLINQHFGVLGYKYYMGAPIITEGLTKRADVQVVILMDYFTNILLKFKAYTGISVLQPLNALYQNTDLIKWHTIFCKEVLSFMAAHDVLKVVIINDSKLSDEIGDQV